MRTTTLARGGALLTALTVAVTLGTAPSSASDSHHVQIVTAKMATPGFTAQSHAAPAARPNASTPSRLKAMDEELPWAPSIISEIRQKNITMYEAGTYIWDGSMKVTGLRDGSPGSIAYIKSHLYVAGKNRGAFEFGYDKALYDGYSGIILPSNIATGKARLWPSTVVYNNDETSDYENTHSNKHSNYFYIRRGTGSTASGEGSHFPLYVIIGSKTIRFNANQWKIFKPSTGKIVPMRTIKLQYLKSSHNWVTLKTIKLDSKTGSGTYSMKKGTKRHYRLYYPTTESIYGSYTESTPRL